MAGTVEERITTGADGPEGADARIPTNLRLLLLLEEMGRAGEPRTPTELGRAVGLAKQTAHRLCRTLEAEGFVQRGDADGRLVPAPRARAMAEALGLAARDRRAARRAVLSEVARATGETVNLVVPGEGGMRYLDRVETDWPFRVQLPVGTEVPFHCTASGKCFLASLSPRVREATVGALDLHAHTDRTTTGAEALLRELAEVARDGHAVDEGEFLVGMNALAVPILDAEGRFMAALASHGPEPRFDRAGALATKGALVAGAARLAAM